jgi:hypothetical protein
MAQTFIVVVLQKTGFTLNARTVEVLQKRYLDLDQSLEQKGTVLMFLK